MIRSNTMAPMVGLIIAPEAKLDTKDVRWAQPSRTG
jgi:hypothetical protein